MFGTIAKGLSTLFSIVLFVLQKIKEKEIRADGAREARQESLEADKSNARRSNEIDAEVSGTVIDVLDARDRLRQRDLGPGRQLPVVGHPAGVVLAGHRRDAA